MPIYEFICNTCEKPFEELVRSANAVDEVICPECGSPKVQKQISMFASRVSGGSTFSLNSSSAASCSTGST